MKHDCDSAETAASLAGAGSQRKPQIPASLSTDNHPANAPRDSLARGVCVSA